MARKRTGTLIKTRDGRWQAMVLLADGKTRKRLKPFPKGTSEAMAREKAAFWAEKYAAIDPKREAAKQELPDTPMAKWFKAWIADREARGLTSTPENRSQYRLHIAPSIGPKHVKDWTRDDLRKLSRELDAKVQAGDISWKMAQNIWTTATKMCGDATESKQDAIRCRDDNPAPGIRGPERGAEKGKEFLYPSEFLTFVKHPEVPLSWRRLVAFAVYTYLRAGELRVLRWEDVDLEHGVIRVHRALNRSTGGEKSTKGRRARTVPIEPALMPLVTALHQESGGQGLVFDLEPEFGLARGLRRWLKVAGVTRAALHDCAPTRRVLTFHDLRGTGITWMAVRGDDALKIQQRAGHAHFQTTQGYIRTAEDHRHGFGSPFPELPDARQSHAAIARDFASVRDVRGNLWAQQDLNL